MKTTSYIKMLAMLLCGGLLLPGVAMAVKGPQGVQYTVHNLSSTTPNFYFQGGNEDEICIFCHTPHGGILDGPLWNRNLPVGTFTHYNSATLEATAGSATRPVKPESLLCLSCHDGLISVSRVINESPSGPITFYGDPNVKVSFAPGTPNIPGPSIGMSPTSTSGRDLTDDHPISLSYRKAYDSEVASGANGLNDPTAAVAKGVRVFGADERVECSSCHDPHVDYDTMPGMGSANTDPRYAPFLIMPNDGSALCLACHNK